MLGIILGLGVDSAQAEQRVGLRVQERHDVAENRDSDILREIGVSQCSGHVQQVADSVVDLADRGVGRIRLGVKSGAGFGLGEEQVRCVHVIKYRPDLPGTQVLSRK